VFVGGLGRLGALDAATGRRRWSGLVEFLGDESAVTAPVIANGSCTPPPSTTASTPSPAHPTGPSRWAAPTAG
jgi:hypothetical protein